MTLSSPTERLRAGSSSSPQVQCFNVHAVFAIFLHTCSTCPCRTVNERFLFLFFPRQIVVFFRFLGYLGLSGFPHLRLLKKNRYWFARGILTSESIPQKRRGHLDLCAVNLQKLRLRIESTWFHCRLDFGRYTWLDIGPTQSVLRIFAQNFVQTCLGAPGNGSFWKKMRKKGFLATETPDYFFTSLKACDWSGHLFGASASPRSSTKKLAMSPSSTVGGGQRDTKYVTFELLLHEAFVANLGF